MITDEQRRDLTWMGYRDTGCMSWAKPVGYSLVVFRTDRGKIESWFTGADGRPHLYSSAEYSESDGRLKECLAKFEAYHLLPAGSNRVSDMGFFSIAQTLEGVL